MTIKNSVFLKLQYSMLCILFLFLTGCNKNRSPGDKTKVQMCTSLPVWAEGREKEMNLTLGFRGVFNANLQSKAIVRIAASTVYRIYLNGDFVGSGTPRTAHGYFRVDQYELTE